jgi:hypothetical protein
MSVTNKIAPSYIHTGRSDIVMNPGSKFVIDTSHKACILLSSQGHQGFLSQMEDGRNLVRRLREDSKRTTHGGDLDGLRLVPTLERTLDALPQEPASGTAGSPQPLQPGPPKVTRVRKLTRKPTFAAHVDLDGDGIDDLKMEALTREHDVALGRRRLVAPQSEILDKVLKENVQQLKNNLPTPTPQDLKVGFYPIVTLEKTATEYDRKFGIKWLSSTGK